MKKIIGLIVIIILALAYIFWQSGPVSAPEHKTVSKQLNTQQTASAKVADSFDKNQYSLSDPTSLWVVVNKQRPLDPKDYVPADLVSVGNGQQMRTQAATALKAMIASASQQGLNLYAASGYRSYKTQVAAYGSMVKAYGKDYADSLSARPGYSEHQTGWAVDLASGKCSLSNCFAETAAGKWVATNAYKFGFLLRYPKGLETVTGYDWESWHYRYIGDSLATEMHKNDSKTLEQFFGLPAAPNYQ